ncbi:MAG: ZIP family metal transporter [Bacteroidales bacterium]|nr:ZIP family metal transporter [Bacteroidales bacterium]
MDLQYWGYPLISTILVSLVSLTGIIFLNLSGQKLEKLVFILVSLAVGVILGNTFLHIIPESYEYFEHSDIPSLLICFGIVLFFIAEKALHWHHHHVGERIVKPLGKINLLADGIHNFTDGILIAAAWMTDSYLGISTTIAVLVHEVPQEIADFGILLHAGYSRKRALMWNFVSALSAIVGTILMLWVGSWLLHLSYYVLPIAAGGFIYLAGSDLIPELNKQISKYSTLVQIVMVVLGIVIMYLLSTGIENHAH